VSVNPLAGLTDTQIFNGTLMLNLACGKAKSILRREHRVVLCELIGPLQTECTSRGIPVPAAPFSTGQQRKA
jgi:hypothetical protein